MIWIVPTTVCAAITFVVYPNLDFDAPSNVNRVVAYSAALVTLPAPIAVLICGFRFGRYVLLAVWPGGVCIRADAHELACHLGPFGNRRYDAHLITAQYPFEMEDDGDGGFEAFLPEEEQMARLLPRLAHPGSKAIRQTILDFCEGDEASIAARFSPVIQHWRSFNATARDSTERIGDD